MNSDISEWLETLTPDQLELVKKKVAELAEQKKSFIKNPGAFSLEVLAVNLDLDITSLERQINSSAKKANPYLATTRRQL